jgi:hypothetical protein
VSLCCCLHAARFHGPRSAEQEFVVLTVRDAMQTVSVPVHVELKGDSLTATGRFAIKQSAFGIKPISVGGVVAVKDRLDVDFLIAATK